MFILIVYYFITQMFMLSEKAISSFYSIKCVIIFLLFFPPRVVQQRGLWVLNEVSKSEVARQIPLNRPLLFKTLQAQATATLGIQCKRETWCSSALGSWEFSGQIQTVSYL